MTESISQPLSKQLLTKGFVPFSILVCFIIAWQYSAFSEQKFAANESKLKLLSSSLAVLIEQQNQQAAKVAFSLAEAQTAGLFGEREQSKEYLCHDYNIKFTIGDDFYLRHYSIHPTEK